MSEVNQILKNVMERMDDLSDAIIPGPDLLNHDDTENVAIKRHEYEKLAKEEPEK